MNQTEEVSNSEKHIAKRSWRSYVPHLLISVMTGLILFGVLIYSAWINLRNDRNIFPEQGVTRFQLQSISGNIKKFQEDHERFPVDLNELDEIEFHMIGRSSGFLPMDGKENFNTKCMTIKHSYFIHSGSMASRAGLAWTRTFTMITETVNSHCQHFSNSMEWGEV